MFARMIEFTAKVEKKDELIELVRRDILPILKKQPGFLELLPFIPEIVNEKQVSITLWTEKRDADRYVKEVWPKVEQLLKPYLSTPINFRTFTLETTLCENLVEALSHAA